MKRTTSKLLLAAAFGLFLCIGTANGQGLKGLVNKVKENESVKNAYNAIKENETVKTTVEAVKASVVEEVNAKIENLANPKAAEVAAVKAPAQALAPDVKNAVSDIRAFTGLTNDELEAKMKALTFAVGTDNLALGGVVYTSKTAGYTLAVKMGSRNNTTYVCEITKATVSKKANLATVKTNFLKLGKSITDLKALSTTASVAAKNAKGTNVVVENPADRTAKFLPALNTFAAKKEDGKVTDAYAETDYGYELKLSQSTVKAVSTAVTYITVTDLTVAAE